MVSQFYWKAASVLGEFITSHFKQEKEAKAWIGCTGVALSAYGAHGLAKLVGDDANKLKVKRKRESISTWS
jgi:hypothetical protein